MQPQQQRQDKQTDDYIANRHRLNRYGLLQEDFDRLIVKQGKRCKICLSLFDPTKAKAIHIDHDHETGKVRALLCRLCNTGLGMVKDNPFILARMTAYLKWTGTDVDPLTWEQTDFVDLRVLTSPPSTDEQSSSQE